MNQEQQHQNNNHSLMDDNRRVNKTSGTRQVKKKNKDNKNN
jgi:hypothetical protein